VTARTYSSPAAFNQALEQRLRTTWKTGPEFARRRQLLVFDRFLARAATVLGDAMTLKGGLVLELRLERARTTRDVDLRLTGSPDDVLAKLQAAARLDLDDFLTFEIARDTEHPDINGDGVLYDGMRFRAECRLAGRSAGRPRVPEKYRDGVALAAAHRHAGRRRPYDVVGHVVLLRRRRRLGPRSDPSPGFRT